ncbi:MAG: single-stranded-DNA-specific exonuclease RecJ [Desulfobulbus propionicus]|nr:MAG: single-stranded-DNA-specific exonuclease RecJ [Desulfobulbus propionicus]
MRKSNTAEGSTHSHLVLAKECKLPRPLALILQQRGVDSPEKVSRFLYPDFSMLPVPGLMKGVEAGVSCIVQAVKKNKPIVVHGDYDVDGVTATVLLVDFFRKINNNVTYYIPNRLTEQYGLTCESVRSIHQSLGSSSGVIVTVDCGITSFEAVEHAHKLGLEVVITDHHEPESDVPQAEAVINPRQKGCTFPFKELAGVGVAFFFVAALRRTLVNEGYLQDETSVPNLKQYLDLVALGTVADVMPLLQTNRVLVRAGMEVLNDGRRCGIEALCRRCGVHKHDKLFAEDISYRLAPRINAAGRLGNVDVAVRLLLGTTQAEVETEAAMLEQFNHTRKELEQGVLKEMYEQCDLLLQKGYKGLAVYHPDCHPGIVGIVASRIVDRYHLPAIVVTREKEMHAGEEMLKGSGRSVQGINLLEKIELCKQFMTRFGGHVMAVGITLEKKKWESFQSDFAEKCGDEIDIISKESPKKPLADCCLADSGMLTDDLVRFLQLLQPFGEKNSEPLFQLKKVRLTGLKNSGQHLTFKLPVAASMKNIRGIGFYMAEKKELASSAFVDIIFKLRFTYFRGQRRKEILLVDVTRSA